MSIEKDFPEKALDSDSIPSRWAKLLISKSTRTNLQEVSPGVICNFRGWDAGCGRLDVGVFGVADVFRFVLRGVGLGEAEAEVE